MPLRLRPAQETDSAKIGRIGYNAFQGTLSSALFPPHLYSKSESGDPALDEVQWRAARNSRRMKDGKPTFVVVDVPEDGSGAEVVVGFAQWDTPSQAAPAASEVVAEADLDPLPGSLDQEEFRKLHKVIEEESKKALGPDGSSKMWYLMSLAIDPAQQRRGVGKILVKYGLEQAAKDGMDAFLISTPAGQRLYQSLGFRNVGEPFMMCNTPHYSMLWKRPADGSS